MERFERRFISLMVCVIWVHVTRDVIWLTLFAPIAAGLWAWFSLRREDQERVGCS